MPASMIYTHLVEKTSRKFFPLVSPRTLTSELRQKRVELAGQLLRVLDQ
jgi:ribosomal protein L28